MKPSKAEKKPRGNPGIADAGVATRFKHGRSANPGGRPRRTPYADAHRIVADLSVSELRSSPGDPVAFGIAKALARAALAGKISAAAECANRAKGTPQQTVNVHEHDAEEPKLSLEQTVESIRKMYGLNDIETPIAKDESGEIKDPVAKAALQDPPKIRDD
jgi:Family of unknown function (DUF5681)